MPAVAQPVAQVPIPEQIAQPVEPSAALSYAAADVEPQIYGENNNSYNDGMSHDSGNGNGNYQDQSMHNSQAYPNEHGFSGTVGIKEDG
jgi:hypothetical protein